MQVDWRSLLDSARVPWRDRGKNTGRGNINICCPWCRDDQGFHLGISEHKEAYYCFRRPEHAGGSFVRLLVKLGQGRVEAVRLLNEHRGRAAAYVAPEPIPASKQQLLWERFIPAAESDRYLDYIESRGFDDPVYVAQRYDLRYAPAGKWAGRLLMPLVDEDQLRGWTGRAIRPDNDPKYLTEGGHVDGLIYCPRPPRDLLLINEGPMDALKLAAAGERLPVAALALTGKQLNESRLWRLRCLGLASSRVLLALDADTSLAEASRRLAALRGALPDSTVARLRMPEGFKDCGEMPINYAEEWLRGLAI